MSDKEAKRYYKRMWRPEDIYVCIDGDPVPDEEEYIHSRMSGEN
jgi:hypothetical protein